MSDHEKNDQADFEIVSPVIEEIEVQTEILDTKDHSLDEPVKVVGAGDDEDDVVSPYGGDTGHDPVRGPDDDLADFSDIDDGIEDANVFSASSFGRNKPKKFSSSMTAIVLVLLAVGGAGGYFYYANPDLVSQIKGNLSGESAPSELLSDINGMAGIDAAGSTQPLAQPIPEASGQQVPLAAMETADLTGMPPQPEPVVGDVPADRAMMADVPQIADEAQDTAPEAISETMTISETTASGVTPPQEGDAVAVQKDSAPMEAVPAETNIAASDDMIVIGDAGAASAPAPIEAPVDVPAAEPTVKAAVVSEDVIQNPDPAKLAPAVEPQKEMEVVAETQKSGTSVSLQEQNDEMNADTEKETEFYDAPPGKIMAGLPAPSMNVKRGKNESIIVVNSAEKSHSGTSKSTSKSTGKTMTKKMSIETTSLDDKVVAAGRAFKLGRYDAAREMYEELYNLNPRDARVLMGRAVLYQKLGETARAIASYEELLAVAPDNAEAVVNLAGLIRKDQPAVALSKLLDLRQKYPDNAAVAAQLGVAYADSGNLQDAFRYLDRAARMEPENPQHYFNMAIVSERAHDVAGAVRFYEKALEVDAIRGGQSLPRDVIYDRLTRLRGQ